MSRKYYSVRTGKYQPGADLNLQLLKDLFWSVFKTFQDNQYFDEAFGYDCVDAGHVVGTMGEDIELQFFRALRKRNKWPISQSLATYTEEDLFDVIELLHDNISKPLDGTFHSYNGCGMHYETFDRPAGQGEFRAEINALLADYSGSYILSEKGEIRSKAEKGFQTLVKRKLPGAKNKELNDSIDDAISLFQRHHSSLTDRHNAVRMLMDVLEELRPKLKSVLTKRDEADLFQIANEFGIRHKNDRQKNDYDRAL
jgi:hypothetical protein